MILKTQLKIYPSIFVHIPKCGGSSIKQMLNDKNDKSIIHNKLKDDIEDLKKENLDYEKYLIFTMLRNPWDRMVSYYFFYKNIIKTNETISLNSKKFNFSDWLKLTLDDQEKFYFIHENYLDYLTYENKILVDYTMNFNFFKNECIELQNILKFNNEIIHANKTNHEFYKTYYSEEDIQLVYSIYKRDIDFFQFDFDKSDQMKKIKNETKIKNISSKKLSM